MREKKIYCGNQYMEVDIFPCTFMQQARKGKRAKKKKISAPKQRNLNDKNARRYFMQLVKTNFSKEDLHIVLTYKDEFLPSTVEEAEKIVKNFLRRVKDRRHKEKLEPLKYIVVTEKGEENGRIHHHLFMNGGLDRSILQALWSARRIKGEKEPRYLGKLDAHYLKPKKNGLDDLAAYLSKSPEGKKRWIPSKNLKKPVSRNNDFKYSKSEVARIAKAFPDITYWEKKYKGWTLAGECDIKVIYNENIGWSIYAKLCRKESAT